MMRCYACGEKIVDDNYDTNTNKVVLTCKKCGEEYVKIKIGSCQGKFDNLKKFVNFTRRR